MREWYCSLVKPWFPFLAGCLAGILLALGFLVAIRSGVAAVDGDWGYVTLLILSSACFSIGGWFIISNGMEFQ